jgi:hypothetical protein
MNLESHAKCGQPLLTEEWNKKQKEKKAKEYEHTYQDMLESENQYLRNKVDALRDEKRREQERKEEEARLARDREAANSLYSNARYYINNITY